MDDGKKRRREEVVGWWRNAEGVELPRAEKRVGEVRRGEMVALTSLVPLFPFFQLSIRRRRRNTASRYMYRYRVERVRFLSYHPHPPLLLPLPSPSSGSRDKIASSLFFDAFFFTSLLLLFLHLLPSFCSSSCFCFVLLIPAFVCFVWLALWALRYSTSEERRLKRFNMIGQWE